MRLRVDLAAPAVVNDLLSFLVKEQFMFNYEKCPDLIHGFKRINTFSMDAPIETWKQLFLYLNTLTPADFNSRHGMLIFAIYVQARTIEAFRDLEIIDRLAEDDPVLEKRRLFEVACSDIIAMNTTD